MTVVLDSQQGRSAHTVVLVWLDGEWSLSPEENYPLREVWSRPQSTGCTTANCWFGDDRRGRGAAIAIKRWHFPPWLKDMPADTATRPVTASSTAGSWVINLDHSDLQALADAQAVRALTAPRPRSPGYGPGHR